MYNPAVTFGKFKKPVGSGSASDYIRAKQARTMYRSFNTPDAAATLATPTGLSYYDRGLLRTAKMEHSTCYSHVNRRDLGINLHTVMDMTGVCVVQNSNTNVCAEGVDPDVPFYLNYAADPDGVLFGNSQCGIYNYEKFMRPNVASTLYGELQN